MGYRGFEIKKVEPLFPFGHGLSYTQFEYSELEVTSVSPEGRFTVTFKVKNIGDVYGREIAQIYITDHSSSLPRPIKELKGFTKVDLKPGEIKQVGHVLDRESLSFYDDHATHWVAEGGKYQVAVAASSVDIRLTKEFELTDTFTWTGL